MPRIKATGDSDNEDARDSTEPQAVNAKNKANSTENGAEEPAESGTEDEDEEEYEIEKILNAKRDAFPEGRWGYFVKWKGYEDEHNSWVDEQDAGNAQALIDTYWRKHKKDTRKSLDAKPKTRRKSGVPEGSEGGSGKKRGRAKASSAKDGSDTDHDPNDEPRTKKSRKSGTKATKKTAQAALKDEEDEDEDAVMGEVVLQNMDEYMNLDSWEDLVESIDTVERTEDNDLQVYFKLQRDGARVMQLSGICAQKFPQKMIQFYESNLRWKTTAE